MLITKIAISLTFHRYETHCSKGRTVGSREGEIGGRRKETIKRLSLSKIWQTMDRSLRWGGEHKVSVRGGHIDTNMLILAITAAYTEIPILTPRY